MDSLKLEFTQVEIETILNMGTPDDVSPFWSTISKELPLDLEDFLTAELAQVAKDFDGFLAKVDASSPDSPLEPTQYLFDIGALLRRLAKSDSDGVIQCWTNFVEFVKE